MGGWSNDNRDTISWDGNIKVNGKIIGDGSELTGLAGGSQTPWTTDIDGAGFNLFNSQGFFPTGEIQATGISSAIQQIFFVDYPSPVDPTPDVRETYTYAGILNGHPYYTSTNYFLFYLSGIYYISTTLNDISSGDYFYEIGSQTPFSPIGVYGFHGSYGGGFVSSYTNTVLPFNTPVAFLGTIYDTYIGTAPAFKSIDTNLRTLNQGGNGYVTFDYGNKLFMATDGTTPVATWSDTRLTSLIEGGDYALVSDIPDVSGFFTLDQTTPQTIANGIPYFSAGLQGSLYDNAGTPALSIDPNARINYAINGTTPLIDHTGTYNAGVPLSFDTGGDTFDRPIFVNGIGDTSAVLSLDPNVKKFYKADGTTVTGDYSDPNNTGRIADGAGTDYALVTDFSGTNTGDDPLSGHDTSELSDTTDFRYVTDTDLTNLSNLSGTNTGDQNLAGILSDATITPVADGTYNFFNDGITTGQVTSITFTSGIATTIAVLP